MNPFDIHFQEYEKWFVENENTFYSELEALKAIYDWEGSGVEVGVGCGIFASKLGIREGIDPSMNMLKLAEKRCIKVKLGFAENLPYKDSHFDYVVFITALCFVNDVEKSLKEANRILKKKGTIIIAFIDKQSIIGKGIETSKEESKFYKNVKLFSTTELISLLEINSFQVNKIMQTLKEPYSKKIEKPKNGYGLGSYVIINARKIKS